MEATATFTIGSKKVEIGLAYVETVKGFDYMSLEKAKTLAKTGELVAIHRYPGDMALA